MARPKKKTVDYFPHFVDHGKTMFILEQKYGNDGYTFWFKLLEMLGKSAGHYLDLNDDTVWEFLQAKTRLTEGYCAEILALLAKLGAIDPELWSVRVVWSQNFVDGIADVYRNRRVAIPSRPSFYIEKPRNAGVSTPEKPQSKVKESKVNQSKAEEEGQAAADADEINIVFDDDEPDLVAAEAYRLFEQEFGRTLSPIEAEEIGKLADEYGLDIVREALRRAVVQGKRSLRYTQRILGNWRDAGLKTLLEVLDYEQAIEAKKNHRQATDTANPSQSAARAIELENRRRQETITAACSFIRVNLGDRPPPDRAEQMAREYDPALAPEILKTLYGSDQQ